MKISYSLTPREFAIWFSALFKHQSQVHPASRYLLWFFWLTLIVLAGALVYSVLHIYITRSILGLPVGQAFVAPCGLLPAIFATVVTLWFSLRHATLSIDPEKITASNRKVAVDIPWRDVTVLEEDAQSITIGAKLSGSHAPYYMIPKRAFATAGEANAFFGQAASYWEEAAGRPVETSNAWPPPPMVGS